MKKCDYCAKETSYYDQYCDENCEKKALDFYTLREKYQKPFGALNIFGVFLMPVGIFLSAFDVGIGSWIVSAALLILGSTVFFLPFPVENMISSMKIKKAVFVTRMIGVALFSIGIIILIIKIFFK